MVCLLSSYLLSPDNSLQNGNILFIPVASRLVNDDSPMGRSMVAEVMKDLITNVRKYVVL